VASRSRDRLLRCLLTAVLALCLTACARPFVRTPGGGDEGRRLLARLEETNRGLWAVKGVGSFSLRLPEGSRSARVAWIAAAPDRIRLHVFGLLGQGRLTLAADGRRITLHSAADGRFYSRRADDPDLQKVVGFPIHVSDLVSLLMGRIPLRDHTRTRVVPDAGGSGGLVLSLDGFWGSRQKITFDARGRVREAAYFGAAGGLRYRVTLTARRRVDGYELPQELRLSTEDGRRLRLVVSRCWANPALPEGVFRLAPSGGA